jgi:DNA gyrase subunit B
MQRRTGTEVRFLASTDTFSNLDYSFKTLENRLRELAFLNSGVKIVLRGRTRPPSPARSRAVLRGRRAGIREISRPLQDPMIAEPIFVEGERDGIGVEVAMWWNDSYNEMVLPFTNNIPQRDGGTHLAGFRGALTRTINLYALLRHRQAREGQLHRRRRARGADLRAVGQGARSEVQLPDQGQAGQLRGAPRGRGA